MKTKEKKEIQALYKKYEQETSNNIDNNKVHSKEKEKELIQELEKIREKYDTTHRYSLIV